MGRPVYSAPQGFPIFARTALTYGLGIGIIMVALRILDMFETTKYVLTHSTSMPLHETSWPRAPAKYARNCFEDAYVASMGERVDTPANEPPKRTRPRLLIMRS